MLFFAENTNGYRRIGLGLLLALLNVFVIGFPPFQTGIWVQSEPDVLAVFIGAALSALWLGIGIWRRWLVMPFPLPPIIIALLAGIGWQCIATAMAQLPVRSWYGPPQTGDGTAMSVAVLLMAWMAIPLWQVSSIRRVILLATTASLVIQCGLHFYYPKVPGNEYMPERWIPAQWPEYLPFLGGYLWVAAFASGVIVTDRQYSLALTAMGVLLVDSCNRSAIGFFSLALITTMLALHVPRLRALFRPIRKWRIFMLLACVLPFSLVLISPLFPAPSNDSVPSGIDINAGIGSRLILDRVGMSALVHEPQRLLVGSGWGTYTDDLFKYGLVDGIHTYKNGVRDPNWFLVDGTSHHSHNQPLEALLSLGLIGMLLWYAVPMIAIWTLPEAVFWSCAPMSVALTGLGHFWFQLPQCFPYQALYLAALVSVCKNTDIQKWRFDPACISVFSLCGLIAMTTSAWGQGVAMFHADQVHRAVTDGSYKNYSEGWLAWDLRLGGDRWATSARYYDIIATNKAARHDLDDKVPGWCTYFMHNARQAAQNSQTGARTSAIELRLQYSLLNELGDPRFAALRHEAALDLEEAVIRMLQKAPLRDDYTAPFLLNLAGFTHKDAAREIRILRRMLAIAPNNRGALWTLGHILLSTHGQEEQGRAMVQKALALHVENAFPVKDTELRTAYSKAFALDKP